jgi:hypothetical protein
MLWLSFWRLSQSFTTDVGLPVVAIGAGAGAEFGFGVGVVVGFPEGAGTSGEESPSEPHHAAVPPAPAHASELAMFPAFEPSSQSHGSPVEDQ